MPAIAETPPITAPKSVRVPKMKDLTGDASETTPPTATPSVEGPPVPPPAPPAAAPDDKPFIPTSILGAERPEAKTQAAIIEQRRQAKEAKHEVAAVNSEFEAAKIELATMRTEMEKLRAERERFSAERSDFEKLATQRGQEVEEVRKEYVRSHQPTFDPSQDDTFSQAQGRMMTELKANLPATIRTAAGDKRLFFDIEMRQPGKQQGMLHVLDTYEKAERLGNEEGMDLSVQAMAQLLGADVDMTSSRKEEWKTLRREDPVFQSLETAMRRAVPHYQTMAQRHQQVTQEAPQLAQRAFQQKQQAIKQTLSQSIFMSADNARAALKVNPNDSVALFSQIIEQIPELKTQVEALLGGYAESFATVPDQVFLPTLAGNDRAAVDQHRQQVQQHKNRLSRAMRYAAIGEAIGPILASLIAERDAAEERATRASENANPGSSSGAGGLPSGGSQPSIPTSIIGAERNIK